MNALETFKAEVTECIRKAVKYPNEQVDIYLIEQLSAAATKYADERLRAELEALNNSAFESASGFYVSADDIEARLARLTAEGK